MKKIELLVCCCLLMAISFGTTKSATLEVVSADTLKTVLSGDTSRVLAYANVKNVSQSSIDVIVGLTIVEKTPNQQIQVCFAGGCQSFFPPKTSPDETEITYSIPSATLAPGQTTNETGNDFDCLITDKTTLGETIVIFHFINDGNRKDFVNSTVRYVVTSTGVQTDEIGKANGASVYPNPARTAFTVDHDQTSGNIDVYSASGAKVCSRSIQSGSSKTTIETTDLAPGTYFFTISNQGTQSASGKFQVVK